jgi:hypothetical protein
VSAGCLVAAGVALAGALMVAALLPSQPPRERVETPEAALLVSAG